MVLNTTEVHLDSTRIPDKRDRALLETLVGDVDRIDEVVALLCPYDAHKIIVEADEEYASSLAEEFGDAEVISLGEYLAGIENADS